MASDGGLDPRDAVGAAQGIGDMVSHGWLLAAGAGAAVLRLATYSGPPRPFGALVLDTVVMLSVGFGVGEIALGMTGNGHLAIGLSLASGLVGWETVKHLAARRAAKAGEGK